MAKEKKIVTLYAVAPDSRSGELTVYQAKATERASTYRIEEALGSRHAWGYRTVVPKEEAHKTWNGAVDAYVECHAAEAQRLRKQAQAEDKLVDEAERLRKGTCTKCGAAAPDSTLCNDCFTDAMTKAGASDG